eukprot:scaffold44401_cov49-Phaeocystis_antarctica.AAC.2
MRQLSTSARARRSRSPRSDAPYSLNPNLSPSPSPSPRPSPSPNPIRDPLALTRSDVPSVLAQRLQPTSALLDALDDTWPRDLRERGRTNARGPAVDVHVESRPGMAGQPRPTRPAGRKAGRSPGQPEVCSGVVSSLQ